MNRKKGFTLIELLISITIIGILSSIGLNTFTSAQIKGRDAKRKAYLRQISDSLESYYNDKGEYPDDDGNGNMEGCGADGEEVCTWGESVFQNTTTGTIYMTKLPADPTLGLTYFYDATNQAGRSIKYQLYARLENVNDVDLNTDEDDNMQVYDNLNCGSKECNYGVSSTNMLPGDNRTLVTE